MSSPTESVPVTIHATPSSQLIIGEDATAVFRGRNVTVLEGRFLATDGQNYDTYTDAKIKVAPRKESCCSCICSGKLGRVIRGVSYLALCGIGYGIRYFQETYK